MQNGLFSILDEVDSTNNYAMKQIKQGNGINGKAWFTYNQTQGKGQRNKQWISNVGENIIMSIIIKPNDIITSSLYLFNATISKICHLFMSELIPSNLLIKWPNDLFIGDKKAGGILIENIYRGTSWDWTIIGIGINVNQIRFSNELNNATSIKSITNITYDVLELAKRLHFQIVHYLNHLNEVSYLGALTYLNDFLYKKNELVLVEVNNNRFYTTILGVNQQGELITEYEHDIHVYKIGEIILIQK